MHLCKVAKIEARGLHQKTTAAAASRCMITSKGRLWGHTLSTTRLKASSLLFDSTSGIGILKFREHSTKIKGENFSRVTCSKLQLHLNSVLLTWINVRGLFWTKLNKTSKSYENIPFIFDFHHPTPQKRLLDSLRFSCSNKTRQKQKKPTACLGTRTAPSDSLWYRSNGCVFTSVSIPVAHVGSVGGKEERRKRFLII